MRLNVGIQHHDLWNSPLRYAQYFGLESLHFAVDMIQIDTRKKSQEFSPFQKLQNNVRHQFINSFSLVSVTDWAPDRDFFIFKIPQSPQILPTFIFRPQGGDNQGKQIADNVSVAKIKGRGKLEANQNLVFLLKKCIFGQ